MLPGWWFAGFRFLPALCGWMLVSIANPMRYGYDDEGKPLHFNEVSYIVSAACVSKSASKMVRQICSFAHWSEYPVHGKTSPPFENDIQIDRVWNEGNDIKLRSEPKECRDMDELLETCVEMSREAMPSQPHEHDRPSDRNESACDFESTVEGSSACWCARPSPALAPL